MMSCRLETTDKEMLLGLFVGQQRRLFPLPALATIRI
jgi:hypothetical protein